MSIYEELLHGVELPEMYLLRQQLYSQRIQDVPSAVHEELRRSGVLERVRPGSTVALTAGSREITGIAQILRVLCDELKAVGAQPFIIPAMGSHGGAVAENQTGILAHFGITEESMGVPIYSSMETVYLGETEHGVPVYFDRYAAQADAVIPVGRIKIHTCFRGEIESGLMKMLAIGCGKQKGAASLHARGFPAMSQNVTQVARLMMQKIPVVFGFGILENALHETCGLYAIKAEEIEEREKEILKKAHQIASRIPFEKIDMLIVDQMGKNISGTGMDPNVTGRSSPLGTFAPAPERLVVLDLTEESDGNAYGVGNADVITERLYRKIVFTNTYPNGITNRDIKPMMIPTVMPNDKIAIQFAMATVPKVLDLSQLRIVWLHNTLEMDRMLISSALLKEVKDVDTIMVEREHPRLIQFDDQGAVYSPFQTDTL